MMAWTQDTGNYSIVVAMNNSVNTSEEVNMEQSVLSDSDMDVETYRYIREVCYKIVMPAILGFGVLGNLLNLVILLRKRYQKSMDKMERCASMGFIFLAASDLAYCLIGFPSAFLQSRHVADWSSPREVVELYYSLYKPAIFNIFLLCSTWCVVLIALERYLVVTHPMKARSSVRLRRTVILLAIIPIAAVILNIPTFLTFNIHSLTTSDNTTFLMPAISPLSQIVSFRNIYRVVWNVVGTFIPMAVLCFCNSELVRAICKTRAMREANIERYSTRRVTFILIAIIILFFVLVCPSSILHFTQDIYTSQSHHRQSYKYLTAIVICNVLQSTNFAINFILYFGMNPKFRANLRVRCTGTCDTGKHVKKRIIKQYELVGVVVPK